jgi:hypothetical protein
MAFARQRLDMDGCDVGQVNVVEGEFSAESHIAHCFEVSYYWRQHQTGGINK